MNKHGLLCFGLLFGAAISLAGEMDRSERLGLTFSLILTSPLLAGTGILMTGSNFAAELSDSDRRVLVQAREGALHAVASGDLNDVRLQAALALLRSRFALEDMSDLQLAQWIAVNG